MANSAILGIHQELAGYIGSGRYAVYVCRVALLAVTESGSAATWQVTEERQPEGQEGILLRLLGAGPTIAKEGMGEAMSTKTVFTTGEAAKICKVSQQTIIRCFDNGSLKGFRVPGSRFRRIPRNELYQFMRENGIPTDALESGKRKLLLVDDDQELIELLADAFAREGRFDIKTANNGFDAGMLVKEFRPDLVVLDIMLPDINGKEVCQRIRRDPALEAVKVICISGMIEQDKVADLRSAGADDFMQKPFAVEKLMDRVCELLDIEKSVAAG